MFSFTIIFSYNKQEPLLLNERHALSTKQKSKWRFNDESKYTWENNEWQNMSGLVGAAAPLNLSIFVCTGKPTWTPSMLTTSILYFQKDAKERWDQSFEEPNVITQFSKLCNSQGWALQTSTSRMIEADNGQASTFLLKYSNH